MITPLFSIFYLIFGLIIGSFLSVCIYRIPVGRGLDQEEDDLEESIDPQAVAEARKISVIYPPRSFCPACDHQLLWWHNIPVISWILLRGRCHFCHKKISVRYPCIELLSGLLSLLSFSYYGLSFTGAFVYLFCAALIVITFIDYDYYIIPDSITKPGTALGLVLALINQYTYSFNAPLVPSILESLIGFLAGAGFLYLVSVWYTKVRKQDGLGLGDVKLLGMTGAFFGAPGAMFTIFIGSLAGSLIGIGLVLLFGRKMNHPMPFGPYLALGTILFLFVTPEQLELLRSLLDSFSKAH